MNLYEITEQYNSALNELLYNEEIPEEAAIDTIEMLEGELVAKGQNVAAFILNVSYDIEALKQHEASIAARRRSLESRQNWLRQYLLTNMLKSGITEIKATDNTFTVKLCAGKESVCIDDESKLDDKFFKVKKEASKTLIGVAIKGGEEVQGANIEKKPYITIK